MNDIEIGSRVKITSNCKTKGCIGVVRKVYPLSNIATVVISLCDGQFVHDYSLNSLEVIPDDTNTSPVNVVNVNQASVTVDEMPKHFGIVFEHTSVSTEIKDSGWSILDDCVDAIIIKASSKEECVDKLNKLINNGEVDWGICDYLAFDGEVYELCSTQNVKLMES